MSAPLIISVSGLRGEIGASLTPDIAARYAVAFSSSVDSDGPFIITRDGRRSGKMLADAICAALSAVGRTTLDAGVAATPTTGILVRSQKAAGGIQISASHNPKPFNGLKLFSAAGRVIPKNEGEAVLRRYHQFESFPEKYPWVSVEKIGERIPLAETTSAHLAALLATVDAEKIRAKKFRVLLDSNRGAGSIMGKALLDALGCETVFVGATPDGEFEHTPEPTAENLAPLCAAVNAAGVAVAFCQDPDADRLALIDGGGRYIGEECTVALCAEHRLKKRTGNVVVNCATSRMTADIAEKAGGACFRSPVGEANVVDRMIAEKAVFGGEGNGGPIDPAVGFVRDSFVGMANILELLAETGESLAELADELPQYAIVKQKVTLAPDKVQAALSALAEKYAERELDRADGLRIDFPSSWVLIRASNTEPIVRVIAEAETEEAATALCEEIKKGMKN